MTSPSDMAPQSIGLSAEPQLDADGEDLRDLLPSDALLSERAHGLLIQIPQVPPELVEQQIVLNAGYFAYPPQGLLYIGAELQRHDISSSVLDLNLEMLREAKGGLENTELVGAWQLKLEQTLNDTAPTFACVSFMFDPTYPQLKAVCAYLRENRPGLPIFVGGVAATADPERILTNVDCDFVLANEGEQSLDTLLSFLKGDTDNPPKNLFYRDRSKVVRGTGLFNSQAVDFDIRDQYRKINLQEYCQFGSLNNFSRIRGTNVPYATVLTRRGCRARCTFCSVRNFNGPGVRPRGVDGVIEELVDLWENHGIRHFEWLDDDPLYDRNFAVQLFERIAERLPDATWSANNGMIASSITPEILDSLEKSNCLGFTVGLETGNPELLRQVRKPATVKTFLAFAELSRAYPKIFYIVNFILGLPTETFGQMLDSFRVARAAKLDWNNFFNYQPLKNTDAYVAYGGLNEQQADTALTKYGTTIDFNPNRAGVFKQKDGQDHLIKGYDVFELPADQIPTREQIREIWFTLNYIANFLRLPALYLDSEIRVANAIKWLVALGHAYADNPAIDAVIYFLERKLGACSPADLDARKDEAASKLRASQYWQKRDSQFKFSSFLDGQIPELDPRAVRFDVPARKSTTSGSGNLKPMPDNSTLNSTPQKNRSPSCRINQI